jgi:hypothetical protein
MISIGRASKTYPQCASAPTIESPHAYPKLFLFTSIPYDFRARAGVCERGHARLQMRFHTDSLRRRESSLIFAT